ncbi:hypothetical protein V6N12_014255 [Hibiscus sabdariffa]|uniref:Solute-binding protein family 3/N-terminal domain-containing protein n=1 Tax=Hibiscus sabdariffa TaxID=183260 RepID=A0ABR2DL85_9ROSI
MFSVKKINSNWAELSSVDKVGVILRDQTSSLKAKYLAQAPCFIHGSTTSEIAGSWSHRSTHGRRLLSSSSNGGDLGTIIWPGRGTSTIPRGRMMQTSSKVLRIGVPKYQPHYSMIGPVMPTTNGFGFAFPKGSAMAADISREIAKLREDGRLQMIENAWFKSPTTGFDSEAKVIVAFNDDVCKLGQGILSKQELLWWFALSAPWVVAYGFISNTDFILREKQTSQELNDLLRVEKKFLRQKFRV